MKVQREIDGMKNGSKPVYMFDMDGNLLKEFETTQDCADYFEKDRDYVNHNLKYYQKIRKDGVWYKIRRNRSDLVADVCNDNSVSNS